MGGRANNWRRLNLEGLFFFVSSFFSIRRFEDIPRHSIFYDIVSYIESGNITMDLRDKLPVLLTQPTAPSVQLQHIDLLRQIKSNEKRRFDFSFRNEIFLRFRSTNTSRSSPMSIVYPKKPLSTTRRSRRALENATKMRHTYLMTRSESLPTTLVLQYEQQIAPITTIIDEEEESRRRPDNTPLAKEDFNDGEVDALFAWTEQLEWNDDLFKTDRISTA